MLLRSTTETEFVCIEDSYKVIIYDWTEFSRRLALFSGSSIIECVVVVKSCQLMAVLLLE